MGQEQSTAKNQLNIDKSTSEIKILKLPLSSSSSTDFEPKRSNDTIHFSSNDTTNDNNMKTEDEITYHKTNAPSPKLEGFSLVQFKCRKKKAIYQRCQDKIHGSFLEGKENDEDCDDLFETYKRCIFLGMKKDREKRGVGAPKQGSALAEFQEEEIES